MKEQGRRIKKIRQEQNLKQDDFCNEIGISRFSLGRIERGDQAIDSPSLLNLNEKYGVAADWILFGKEMRSDKECKERIKELDNSLAIALEINESHQRYNGKLQTRLTEVEEDNKRLSHQIEDKIGILREKGLV